HEDQFLYWIAVLPNPTTKFHKDFLLARLHRLRDVLCGLGERHSWNHDDQSCIKLDIINVEFGFLQSKYVLGKNMLSNRNCNALFPPTLDDAVPDSIIIDDLLPQS